MVLHLGFSEDTRLYLTQSAIQVLIEAFESYIRYERLARKATLDKKRMIKATENISIANDILGLLKTCAELEKTHEENKHD